MTDSQIEKFICLASTLNVSEAADILEISQPALSKQISAMQTDLGFSLFTRGHDGLKLTDAGTIMLNGLCHMLQVRGCAVERAREADLTNGRKKLRLGLTGQWTLESTGHVVQKLKAATGEDGLRLLHNQLDLALNALHDGKTDLLLTVANPEKFQDQYPDFIWKAVCEDELLLFHFDDSAFNAKALHNATIYYVPGACPAADYLCRYPAMADSHPNLVACSAEEMFWQVASGQGFGAIGRSDPIHQLPQYCFHETGVLFPVYLVYTQSNTERIENILS